MSYKQHKEVAEYVKSISGEKLFEIAPPKTLTTRGHFVGQFNCSCLQCGGKTSFYNYTSGYYRFCSIRCSTQYMVDNESKRERFDRMEKGRKTILKKYNSKPGTPLQQKLGYEHFIRTDAIAQKIYDTNMRLYGHRTGFTKKSCDRRVKSWRHNISLNPHAYSVCHYKIKTISIKGKEFKVQGYEGQVLQYLIKHGVSVNSIKMYPKAFEYIEHGKKRTYIPDIMAKINGRWYMIEVKSNYTAGLTDDKYKTYFYNLKRKSRSVQEAGYRIVTIIYCHKRNKFILYKNIHDLKRKNVIAKFNQ